jgi:hypothetical protein
MSPALTVKNLLQEAAGTSMDEPDIEGDEMLAELATEFPPAHCSICCNMHLLEG